MNLMKKIIMLTVLCLCLAACGAHGSAGADNNGGRVGADIFKF